MNPFPRMDAIPSKKEEADHAAEARRARTILMLAMGGMIALPVLLFVIFHT